MNEVQEQKLRWYQFSKADPNSTWSFEIKSKEAGYETISGTAWTLIILGLISLAISFFVLPDMWFDATLFLFLGSLLGYKKKVWTAWAAIVFCGLSVIATIYNKVTDTPGGGNIFLAAIVLFFAIKSLHAIRFLNGEIVSPSTRFQKIGEKIFPFIFWLSSVVVAIFLFFFLIGSIALLTGHTS